MRCLWKLEWIIAVALLGFVLDASAAEDDVADPAEEESSPPALVEPDAKHATAAAGERNSQRPALEQPAKTTKPAPAAGRKSASTARADSGPELAQPEQKSTNPPAKSKPVAKASPAAASSPAKKSSVAAASAKTMPTPEVRALPVQPPTASSSQSPGSAGVRGKASSAAPAPAVRGATVPSSRLASAPATDTVARPSARTSTLPATRSSGLPTTRTGTQRPTRTAVSETTRTAANSADADGSPRPTRTAATAKLPSRDAFEDEPDVRSAGYQDFGPSPHVMMEPPARIKPHSRGWRMAAMQPAAPRGPAPSVMEEIEGKIEGPIQGPIEGSVEGEEGPPWFHEGDADCPCDEGLAAPMRRWGFTGGVEALIVRPHFSDPQALLATTATQGSNGSEIRDDSLNYDFNYLGSFRMYAGVRNCACGDEFRFSYWNFGGRDTQRGVATATTGFCDFVCNITSLPGDRISQRVGLNVNVFDLEMIKPFYMGQQSCGGCGSSACGTGGCGSGGCGSGDCGSGGCGGGCDTGGGGSCDDGCAPCCPVWDLRWLAGFRFASVNHGLDSQIITTGETVAATGQSRATYFGFGPRMGLQGRRYFGSLGRLSAYAKGTGSLLVGSYEQTLLNFNITPLPTNSSSFSRATRVVPVAELETGVSWRISPRTVLTGGWLVQSWWDLGLQETMSGNDDANILGFDGFFARAEVVF